MSVVFSPLTTSTLRGQIAGQIREAILHGELKAGDRVVERTLANQFGASLTAIREAIITLEAEGFVTKKPNSSTYITKLDVSDLDSIFEVRQLLEPYVLSKVAATASAEQKALLEKRYLDMVDAARQGDTRTYVIRDFAWHSELWTMAGNEYLQVALRRVTLPLFSFSSMRFVSGKAFDLLQDAISHSVLLEQVKSGDVEGARKAMETTLAEWHVAIRNFVGSLDASQNT